MLTWFRAMGDTRMTMQDFCKATTRKEQEKFAKAVKGSRAYLMYHVGTFRRPSQDLAARIEFFSKVFNETTNGRAPVVTAKALFMAYDKKQKA